VSPQVSVLIPFRQDSEERFLLLRWVIDWWRTNHPSYEVVIGRQPDETRPWSKAEAYKDALEGATGAVLVLTDCDVFLPGVEKAVSSVLFEDYDWCRAHDQVWRFNQKASQLIFHGKAKPSELPAWQACERLPYRQDAAGAGTVLHRDTFLSVPMDPRFLGWGLEDDAWRYALQTFCQEAPRIAAPCYHLWHPPQPTQIREGSIESKALWLRYVQAWNSPNREEDMSKLLEEFSTVPE
jgi:hypothetical protein